MSKKFAKIMRGPHSGRGTFRNGILHLRAGRKGTGKVLATVNYLPWSPRSREEAENYLFAAAERQGYEL